MQVVDIPNSMTVLPELLPYSIEMVSCTVAWHIMLALLSYGIASSFTDFYNTMVV